MAYEPKRTHVDVNVSVLHLSNNNLMTINNNHENNKLMSPQGVYETHWCLERFQRTSAYFLLSVKQLYISAVVTVKDRLAMNTRLSMLYYFYSLIVTSHLNAFVLIMHSSLRNLQHCRRKRCSCNVRGSGEKTPGSAPEINSVNSVLRHFSILLSQKSVQTFLSCRQTGLIICARTKM